VLGLVWLAIFDVCFTPQLEQQLARAKDQIAELEVRLKEIILVGLVQRYYFLSSSSQSEVDARSKKLEEEGDRGTQEETRFVSYSSSLKTEQKQS